VREKNQLQLLANRIEISVAHHSLSELNQSDWPLGLKQYFINRQTPIFAGQEYPRHCECHMANK
jgi:hypothetical protein